MTKQQKIQILKDETTEQEFADLIKAAELMKQLDSCFSVSVARKLEAEIKALATPLTDNKGGHARGTAKNILRQLKLKMNEGVLGNGVWLTD